MPRALSLRLVVRYRNSLGWLCLLLVTASTPGGRIAIAADPVLQVAFPFAITGGQSTEVTLSGIGLDQPKAIFFSSTDLNAEMIDANRVRITATPESRPGDCEMWVATADGLTGPRRFRVVPRPVIAEVEPNDDRDASQPLTFPSTVVAKMDKSADLDWFSFTGSQDERIIIEAHSLSLDGSVQPTLRLVGPDGSELAHSRSDRLEPRMVLRLPMTGKYHLLVFDRAYRKDDFSFYQLDLKPEKASAEQHSQVGLLRSEDLFESLPLVSEQAQTRESPQLIELPCRVVGSISTRNDVDWYRFTAQEGETLRIEAFGERLGQLMDLEASLYTHGGKILTTLKDSTSPKGVPATLQLGSLDPMLDWKVPADGEYLLALHDLYGGSVFGDRIYELAVERRRPAFYALAFPSEKSASRGIFLNRGGKAKFSVSVVRTGGFAGEVAVRPDSPLTGLTISPESFLAKEATKDFTVTASKEAPVGFQNLRLVAVAEIGSDERVVPVISAALIRTGLTRRTDGTVVYISE